MTFLQAFRRFVRYYHPYRGLFYFDMVCALAVCAIDLAFPQILNLLTKELFLEEPAVILGALWYIGAGLLASGTAASISSRAGDTSWGRAWRAICGRISSTTISGSRSPITTATTPER